MDAGSAPRPGELAACAVLVTAATFGARHPALREELARAVGSVHYLASDRRRDGNELRRRVEQVDGWIAGLDPIDAALIDAARRLRVIARYGVGYDRVDLQAASRRGIVVTNTPGANTDAVAELAIGLMLTLARRICQANQAVKRGQWPRPAGMGLCGRTVGLVGFGAIGRAVARRLEPFGCRVLAADPYATPAADSGAGAVLMPLADMLPGCDIVSLHAALTPETVGMVDAAFLGRMKPGALLINTARGEFIDEAALKRALSEGPLGGAALDCWRQEPPAAENPLLRLPQLIATPHTGAHTDEALHAMGRMALDACLTVLRGHRPAHVVNPEVYPATERS
jgi:phosphoglycerate dehydrogenase-like enzyme